MNTPLDIHKRREIVFDPFPHGQAALAVQILSGLSGLIVRSLDLHTIEICYRIGDYTLEGLETGLEAQGFHLHNTLLIRIRRALVHYCERTQRENIAHPAAPTKQYKPHIEAWQKRPHGDHDDTPAEWRQYK